MDILKQRFFEKYALTQTDTVRDFINDIDWSNRLIGIKGSRGVGKTTLLLQYIKKNFKPDESVLYVSADHLYFAGNSIYELAYIFKNKGGRLLVIDEIHRYDNWAAEIKNIYDDFPLLSVIFMGSSLLHLHKAKADLSRRAVMYDMQGLSFREFLNFNNNISFKKFTLSQIIQNHTEIALEIVSKIKPLQFFELYLKYGYFPFFLENINSFHQKLSEIILTVLEVDIPQFSKLNIHNIVYLKKLLSIISHSVPFKPNLNALSERTGISLNTLKHYLKLLAEANLLNLLYVEEKGINSLNKPEKIFLHHPNLMYNLASDNINIGNIRETFFFNQVSQKYLVHASKHADFIVDNNYHFEIGGKNKKQKQIKDLNTAYIVKDDIEIGSDNIIPLWLFGFLY
jgi:hypothetical protein